MFEVTWRIEVDAENAQDAARSAQAVLLNDGEISHVFEVTGLGKSVVIDLSTDPLGKPRPADQDPYLKGIMNRET